MVIAAHVVVVKVHQGLDRFLHRRHLDQGHLAVPGEDAETQQGKLQRRGKVHLSLLVSLKQCTLELNPSKFIMHGIKYRVFSCEDFFCFVLVLAHGHHQFSQIHILIRQ